MTDYFITMFYDNNYLKCIIGMISVKNIFFLTKYYSYFIVVYNLQKQKNKWSYIKDSIIWKGICAKKFWPTSFCFL